VIALRLALLATCCAVAASAAPLTPEELAQVKADEAARVAAVEKVYGAVVAIYGQNVARGGGSGVLFHPDGFALTNYHVVRAAGRKGKAGLADGKLYDWELQGIDPGGDLAVIRLKGEKPFPAPRRRLGDGHGQPLQPRRGPEADRHPRHRERPRALPARPGRRQDAGLRQLHSGRLVHQPGQLGRPVVRPGWSDHRHQRARLLRGAGTRQRRPRLRRLRRAGQELPARPPRHQGLRARHPRRRLL